MQAPIPADARVAAPRVLLIDSPASAADDPGRAAGLAAHAHVLGRTVTLTAFNGAATLRSVLDVAAAHRAELVHLADAAYARLATGLRLAAGLPVTVDVTARDIPTRRGWPQAPRDIGDASLAFTGELSVVAALRDAAPNLDVVITPPVARPLPWPSKRAMGAVTRALRDTRPGRLVVGVPWPADRRDLRWFRDSIAPRIEGGPLCLVFGAPDRRTAATLFGARNLQQDFRVLTGTPDVDTVSAVARCVDCFAVPSGFYTAGETPSTAFALSLAMGGVPVVAYGESEARVLAHERNAFIAEPDERAFVHTLDQVLSLPAIQRHALGEDFARYTLRRWTTDAAAELYADRFAALVGRPQIPVDLRAA